MMAGETVSKRLSEFVSVLPGVPPLVGSSDPSALFSDSPPELSKAESTTLAKVLHRATPDAAEIQKRVAELERAGKPSLWIVEPESTCNAGFSSGASWNRSAPVHRPYQAECSPPDAPMFVSAKTMPFKPPSRPVYAHAPARPLSPSKELNASPSNATLTLPTVNDRGCKKLILENAAPRGRAKAAKEPLGGPKQASIETFVQRKETGVVRPTPRTVAGVLVSVARSAPKVPSTASRPAQARSTPPSQVRLAVSTLPPSGSSSPALPTASEKPPPMAQQPTGVAASKRRLGMGRATRGYPNKKFKAPAGGA